MVSAYVFNLLSSTADVDGWRMSKKTMFYQLREYRTALHVDHWKEDALPVVALYL